MAPAAQIFGRAGGSRSLRAAAYNGFIVRRARLALVTWEGSTLLPMSAGKVPEVV